jgi:hypothetical protein
MVGSLQTLNASTVVIACNKREAFVQGSEATKQSISPVWRYGLLRFARNDG